MGDPVEQSATDSSGGIPWSSLRTWSILGCVAIALALLLSASDIIAFSLMKHLEVSPETLDPKWLYTGLICFFYISLWKTFDFVWRKALNIAHEPSKLYLLYFKNDALSWILPSLTVLTAVLLAGYARLVH